MKTWGIILSGTMFSLLSVLLSLFLFISTTEAATITRYSDTLGDSAPNAVSNHTLQFTTTAEIPAGGYVRFRPSPGDFTIPAANFDFDNVELLVATSSGFIPRNMGAAAGTSTDGVAITTGTTGQVEVTLNSLVPIPSGAEIQLKLGTHTTNATGTDTAIVNPTATGTFPIYFETGGGTPESVKGLVAIIENVYVGDLDTTETIPPFRFNGAPQGTLTGTSLNVQVSLETDEFSNCRYATASGTPFFSMTEQFGTSFSVIHAFDIAVSTSTSYVFYVRCIDDEGNFNTDDYAILFDIPEYPEGVPGDDGSTEGEGSGTGEGDGSADPGDGSTTGGEDANDNNTGGGTGSSGGGSGGGSSGDGGDDGGGFEGTEEPYQSGDGRVIINGYAFPNSDITILVDGVVAETDTADSLGKFTVTIDEIARGTYTFGVYATDKNDVKSSTYSTTFSITGSRASSLSNVNVMPSILVDPDPVDPGVEVTFSGFAIPNALVTIENQSEKSSASLKTFTANSDTTGAWSINVSTAGFKTGTYKVRAKAKQDGGVSTDYSGFTYYGVGEEADKPRSSDLNTDGSVNLIDFSILLFWWGTDGGESNPPADINGDGNVSLTDFSIMIFNWTG